MARNLGRNAVYIALEAAEDEEKMIAAVDVPLLKALYLNKV